VRRRPPAALGRDSNRKDEIGGSEAILIAALVIVALAGLLAVYGLVTFNSLVRMRNDCDERFSNMDVQLRLRHDLVPNLVETVRGYASHERQVLERVTAARGAAVAAAGPAERARAEGELGAALGALLAVAERYPELKASSNFLALQRELSAIEDRIQEARRAYNASARDMNIRVETLPSRVVARLAGMGKRDFFELDEAAERGVPSISFPSASESRPAQ
jgi:LemA protein